MTSPLRLAVVCRLAPNKRVDHAIQTAKVLQERDVDVRLTIVGTGEVENSLKQLAKDLSLADRVDSPACWTSKRKTIACARRISLVHTSVREGWGLNVIEANAMGTPAIVYPVGGLVDSTVDNESGLITQEETPASVADTIQGIMKSPEQYARLRIGAWNRAKSLQWEKVLKPACDWLEALAVRK